MKKDKAVYLRKNLCFDTSKPEEVHLCEFFEKCGKKATALTVLALSEFIEKYGLDEKDKNYLGTFVSHFDMFKEQAIIQPVVYNYQPIGVSANHDMPKPEIEEPKTDDVTEKANKLMSIQSMFMSA